jgi:GntR family transcriptional regulator
VIRLKPGLRLEPSPQPLYQQLREVLRERILDGSYAPLARLPSESELMEAYGVSRITVRQAVRDLQKDGLVFSVQGKGSFVTKPKAVQELARLEGFDEAMAPKGYETHSKVLGIGVIRATEHVAAALELPVRTPVVELRRVRYLNRAAISLDVSYFPEDVGKRLPRTELSSRDVFAILENDLELTLESADLLIDATLADGALGRKLRVPAGSPVLRIQRVTRAAGRGPVDFEYLHYAGDAYQYRLRVERSRKESRTR